MMSELSYRIMSETDCDCNDGFVCLYCALEKALDAKDEEIVELREALQQIHDSGDLI